MKSRRASIDIGSNSILLLVGEYIDGQYFELDNQSNVTGLGRGLDQNGEFNPESMEDSLRVLKHYSEIVKEYNLKPSDIIATATEAARVARNSESFFEKVRAETGINVQIITSQAEAYYSTKGIMFNSTFEEDEISIMDIGGASTEIIKVNTKSNKILSDFSMPMGAVRVTSWIQSGEVNNKINQILKDFSQNIESSKAFKLYCVAGTMTSFGNMYLGHRDFQEKEIHGLKIPVSEIIKLNDEYCSKTPEEILERFPFLGKRSQTIVGGLKVALTIFSVLNIKEVQISTYGLRYGTFEQGEILDEHIVR